MRINGNQLRIAASASRGKCLSTAHRANAPWRIDGLCSRMDKTGRRLKRAPFQLRRIGSCP